MVGGETARVTVPVKQKSLDKEAYWSRSCNLSVVPGMLKLSLVELSRNSARKTGKTVKRYRDGISFCLGYLSGLDVTLLLYNKTGGWAKESSRR
jgi:hypothetical protein